MGRKSKLDPAAVQAMLDDGYSYRAVGKQFGVTGQCIYQAFGPRNRRPLPGIERIVYPNIAHWMYHSHLSYADLAHILHYSESHTRKILYGKQDPSFPFVLTILSQSGMTFEEAFQMREIA